MIQLTHEQRKALAARLRKSQRVNSSLVDIEWLAGGMETVKRPGSVFKATVKLKEGRLAWSVFLPAPKNSRQTALAMLVCELDGVVGYVKGSIVSRLS